MAIAAPAGMLLAMLVVAAPTQAAVTALYRLGPGSVAGDSATFPVELDFSADAGEALVFFGVDVSASSPALTAGGTDYSAFGFAKATPLLDGWGQIPGASFGADALHSVVEFETAASALAPGLYTLGRLSVNLATAGVMPGPELLVSLEAFHSVIGVERPGMPGSFEFVDVAFDPGTRSLAGPLVIDNFNPPSATVAFVAGTAGFATEPVLQKDVGPPEDILGQERDLLVDVVGPPGLISATGTVGGGTLRVAISDPTSITLQYDALDADLPSALVNSLGLAADLTGGGVNNRLRLDFLSLDAGPGANEVGITIRATSNVAGVTATAQLEGLLPENGSPYSYAARFGDFTAEPGFSFASVTSLELVLNSDLQRDVDFELDQITATVPEPAGWLLGMAGAILLLVQVERRVAAL